MVFDDVRDAWRKLVGSPVFSGACIGTLVLAIGANAAIFGLVDSILLRPLPIPDSARMVALWQAHPSWSDHIPLSVPTYLDWRDRNRFFEDMAAYAVHPAILSGDFSTQRVEVARVSANFLPLMGQNPQWGHHFRADREGLGLRAQMLLGHALWQRLWGGREEVVGSQVRLDGLPFEIVGTLPPGTAYPRGLDKPVVDLWIPLLAQGEERNDRDRFFLKTVAKLQEGVSPTDARRELQVLAERLAAEHPEAENLKPNLVTLHEEEVGRLRPALLVFWAAVGFVLLLACVNIAGLLLARVQARQAELAVRAALGAGRGRLIRQLLTENLLLALLGGAAGLLAASWGRQALLSLYPERLPSVPPGGLDLRMLAFCLGLSVVSGLAMGILPALSAVGGKAIIQKLGGGIARGASQRRTQLLKFLVAVEVALAMVLTCAAGLSAISLWKLLEVDRGFQPDQVALARIWLPEQSYSGDQSQSLLYEAFLERAAQVPQILSVGGIQSAPLSGRRWSSYFQAQGRDADPERLPTADFRVVLGNYFDTLQITIIMGRGFGPQDDPGAPPVALVNQTLADSIWPGRDPLGMRIAATGAEGEDSWATIVGVVKNIKHSSLREQRRPAIYRPWLQHPVRDMDIVLRGERDILSLAPTLRALLRDLDPGIPALEMISLEERVVHQSARERFAVLLLGLFALTSLAMGAVGTYGVISFSAAQRAREVGIRMALGARRSQILRLFLAQGGRLIGVGLVIGLLASVALTRAMQSLLFQVSPLDPAILLLSLSIVAAAGLAAVWIPSRRAATLDPLRSLNTT